jgi:hypothetical protein
MGVMLDPRHTQGHNHHAVSDVCSVNACKVELTTYDVLDKGCVDTHSEHHVTLHLTRA